MFKRSRQSSSLQEGEKQKNEDDHFIEQQTTKKQFLSTETTKIVQKQNSSILRTQEGKESVKLSLKDLKELKNAKTIKEQQERILLGINNINIQKHVQELLQKFNPPLCLNCNNRRADRICLNKDCGMDKYMQLICGKCHLEKHQHSINKPEVDVEEFFIKLSTYLNEQKLDQNNSYIDTNNLYNVAESINNLRSNLNNLKAKIQDEIQGYLEPREMYGQLSNSITKALSFCEYENLQKQLQVIKKCITFQQNKFSWNDVFQKYSSYVKLFNNLDSLTIETNKKISSSFKNYSIPLEDYKFILQNQQSGGIFGSSTFSGFGLLNTLALYQQESYSCQDGQILVKAFSHSTYQLNYKFQKEKKYKLRFKFPSNLKNLITISFQPEKSDGLFICNFSKNIGNNGLAFTQYSADSFSLVKGGDLSISQGMEIELRIDFQNSYADVYDYPDMNNILCSKNNQSLLWKTQYVLCINFSQQQEIILESIEELSEIDQYEQIVQQMNPNTLFMF